MQIISGESNYWQRSKEEVGFNSGRTPTWEHTPRYLMETICEEPMDTNTTEQPDNPEYEGEGRLVIDTEAAGEYIEKFHDDPLADKKDIKTDGRDTPLDLTTRMEAGEQSRQSMEAMNNTSYQANVEDTSRLPTEAELEAEIEKVKEGVVENLLLYSNK